MAKHLTAVCIVACGSLLGSVPTAVAQTAASQSQAATPLDQSVPTIPLTEAIALNEITLTTAPSPPVRGDVTVVTIEIPNRSTRAWRVSLNADVGAGALYRRASHSPQVRHRVDQDNATLGLAWSLLVAPRSVARVHVDVLMRYEESLPLVLHIAADATDAETQTLRPSTSSTKDLQVDAVWGTADSLPKLNFVAVLVLAVALWALTLPTALMLWRAGQRSAGKRGALRAGSMAVGLIGLVTAFAISLAAASDWSLRGRYHEAACTVTDRLMVQRMSEERVSGRTDRAFALIRGVEFTTPAGTVAQVAGDSDSMPGEYYFDNDARQRFAAMQPGQAYPCWYDPMRPREVTLEFSPSQAIYYALGGVLLLVSAPGFVAALRRPRVPAR
jgi:hypothetical protein